MTWAEMRLSELCERDIQQWGGILVSGTRQDNTKRIAFLEQHGFQYSGKFAEVNMLCFLDKPIPEPVLPAGYEVREVAEMGEVSNRAEAQREVWGPWAVGKVSDVQSNQLGISNACPKWLRLRISGERRLDLAAAISSAVR
jgi:hypothetical protein